MKKIVYVIVGILFISCFGASGITNSNNVETKINCDHIYDITTSIDDKCAQLYFDLYYPKNIDRSHILLNNKITNNKDEYEIGEIIWRYFLTIYDPSPKAIKSIDDINNDGIDDVIVCSEDDYVRCFDGGAIGNGVILWEHEIYSGDVYRQSGLDIIEDVDDDGHEDVVVGATGGARLIRCISGIDGDEIWTHDTHEYGGGGWVYQVDSSFDYNGDEYIDVLAATGDDSSDTGPKRIYCLDGETGESIWEYPLGGPGFAVIGVEDFTGDEQADVIAGASNEGETQGFAYGLNGETGSKEWTFTASGSSVWALEQLGDITNDGIKDIIIGDFLGGNIFGLDATDGNLEYFNSIGSCIITMFAKLNDVNSDNHEELVAAHSTIKATQLICGKTGDFIWTKSVVDQPWNVAVSTDISGDGLDDVFVGTLFNTNYCYFLDGTDGTEIHVLNHGQAVDAIAAIPDVTDDDSMEMVAGGRDGKLVCYSGGLNALINDPPFPPEIEGPVSNIAAKDTETQFNISAIDPDNDDVYFYIDWGDGNFEEWIGPYYSTEVVNVNHTWTSTGDYEIKAMAKDEFDFQSDWSDIYPITVIENSAPSIPEIVGSKKGDVGILYTYSFTSTDQDEDDISYFIKWGDNETTGWTSFFSSGDSCSEGHRWKTTGTFIIQAKAKDIYGTESDWGTFNIEMPRSKTRLLKISLLIQNLFLKFKGLRWMIF